MLVVMREAVRVQFGEQGGAVGGGQGVEGDHPGVVEALEHEEVAGCAGHADEGPADVFGGGRLQCGAGLPVGEGGLVVGVRETLLSWVVRGIGPVGMRSGMCHFASSARQRVGLVSRRAL